MNKSIHRINTAFIAVLTAVASSLYGCSETSNDVSAPGETQPSAEKSKAVSALKATIGNAVSGSVSFVETGNGIHITAQLSGLTPGDHGFHIHEKGDCSSGDGKSAGGHFDPQEVAHGGPDSATRHVGDLGNISADADGNANYDRLDSVVSFEGPNNILGKGVIVHAGADDLTTQPTGDAGDRVACGVIEKAG